MIEISTPIYMFFLHILVICVVFFMFKMTQDTSFKLGLTICRLTIDKFSNQSVATRQGSKGIFRHAIKDNYTA